MPRTRLLPLALLVACADGDAPIDSDSDPVVVDTDLPPVAPTIDAGPDLEVPVGTSATLTANVTDADEILWDLGDGTAGNGASVVHTWDTPGNYVVVAAVEGAGGLRAADTVRVTVYAPAAATPPRVSSAMALDEGRGLLWVAVPESGRVAAVELTTHTTTWVDVCDTPRTVAVDGDRVAVTCEDVDQLAVIDVTTRTVDRTSLPRGSRPFGVVGRDGVWWVSAQGTGEVLRVDGGNVDAAPLGPDPRVLVLGADETVYATQLRTTGDEGLVLTEGDSIPLPFDPGPDSDNTQRGVPTVAVAAAASPDGTWLYVGATLANTTRGTYRDGRALTFETTVRGTLRFVDLTVGEDVFDARKPFDNHGDVTALALSPRGTWLWAAHGGTRLVERLDAFTGAGSKSIIDAGQGIDALALSGDGRTLYVHAWLDRKVNAYDVSDEVGPTPRLLWSAGTVETEPLTAEVLRGKQLFHDAFDRRMSRDGYATCSVCHPDGRDDGIVWDFTNRGEGLRNTVSLEGRAGMGHGPVHWTGNFDEIQDFENDIRFHQGGTGLLTDDDFDDTTDTLGDPKAGLSDDLDALAAYVTTLSTPPRSPFFAPEGGAEAFAAKGCAGCHSGDVFTDSAPGVRHDIGTIDDAAGKRLGATLDGFDTPTLRGAWATAPYLHDGSAATIEDAVNRHANSDIAISAEELALIVDYVQSL